MGCELDGRGSNSGRGKKFVHLTASRPVLRPTQHHIKHVLGIKLPWREAKSPPPSSAEVKIAGDILPCPHTSSCHSACQLSTGSTRSHFTSFVTRSAGTYVLDIQHGFSVVRSWTLLVLIHGVIHLHVVRYRVALSYTKNIHPSLHINLGPSQFSFHICTYLYVADLCSHILPIRSRTILNRRHVV
jgi:hypothetical protein